MDEHPPTYLGDGVYASFDGFQIWLHVGRHDAPRVVAIEGAVLRALVEHAARCGIPEARMLAPAT